MMRKTIVPMVKELLISNMHNYAKEMVHKQQSKDDVSKQKLRF